MTQLNPEQERTSDWDIARDRATVLRLERTERATRGSANRWLAATLVVLWISSIAAHLLARFHPAERDALQLFGSIAALILLIGGVAWLFVSRQFSLSNRYDSPWTPLTKIDRRRIRRQLAGRAPLELDHVDVVLELAHQQRRQTLGSLAVLAIQLPNSLGVALSDPDPVILTLTSAGLLLFVGIGLYAAVVSVRLRSPIHQLTRAAASPTHG